MGFRQEYPTISLLIGEQNVGQLDQHAADLSGKPDEDVVAHYDDCFHRHWCALNTTPECRDEINRIEWSLAQILTSPTIDEAKLRNAFATKTVNPDQFDELLGEIATAVACAEKAKLLALEWKTGKRNCDADVRCEIDGEPINLEVTLRTDSWLDEVTVHMEDIFDEEGKQIADVPPAKTRRTLTDRQWDDLHVALRDEAEEEGVKVIEPKRVSDVIEEKKKPRKMTFVSNPSDMPEDKVESKAYCADGDNKKVESITLQDRIGEKAAKFNADGYHVVVLATLRPGFPSENSVYDAVFGQTPHIKNHGIFEDGLHNEICGVFFLPVYQQMRRLSGCDEIETLAVFFPNHNAQCKLPENLESTLAKVFGAKIRRGWMSEETDAESTE